MTRPAGDDGTLEVLRPMLDGVLAELQAQDPEAALEVVERAFETALVAPRGQVRKSRVQSLIHPLRGAWPCARLGLDPASVAAGLIHDSIEDSDLTVYDVTQTFGREIALLVDGVTKLGKLPYLSRKEQAAESFRKMLLAMSQDIRVLIVKLADRLDNMRSLEHMPATKQTRIASETMDIYVPLAGRLGIEWMRAELQDLSFRYLEPGAYEFITSRIESLMSEEAGFVAGQVARLRAAFTDGGEGEPRHPWETARFGDVEVRASLRTAFSMHRILRETGQELEHPADLVTYQVVVKDRASCYAALGQLHDAFKLIPGAIRDFIALPKPNHYQALHTLVVDDKGVRMDLQIRTEYMDQVAERGIVVSLVSDDETPESRELRLAWLRQLMDWQDEVADPHEFIEAVKADLYSNEVYVYTPQGDMLTFPHGATPIDFAFAIHSDVGLHCSRQGQRTHRPAELSTAPGGLGGDPHQPSVEPRRGWLEICRTARARINIICDRGSAPRSSGGRHAAAAAVRGGARRRGVSARARGAAVDARESASVKSVGPRDFGGDRSYSPSQVAARVFGTVQRSSDEGLWTRVMRRMAGRGPRPASSSRDGTSTRPIVLGRREVRAGDGIATLGPCCDPIPGDPLVGFVVGGRGLMVHHEQCPTVGDQVEAQRVYVVWEEDLKMTRPVTVEVRTSNAVGLLAEMSRVFSEHGADIKHANCRASSDLKRATNTFQASVRELGQSSSWMDCATSRRADRETCAARAAGSGRLGPGRRPRLGAWLPPRAMGTRAGTSPA